MWMPILKGCKPEADNKLRSCPMCGSAAHLQEYIDHMKDDRAFAAQCTCCPVTIRIPDEDEELARSLWNRLPGQEGG